MYNPDLKFFFVVNGAHTNSFVKEVDKVLFLAHNIEGMEFCKTVIHTGWSIAKAPVGEIVGTEMPKDDRGQKVCDEILSFYRKVLND